MRILCLIMVGAFLLSIAIADNGNSVRPNLQNLGNRIRSQPATNYNSRYPRTIDDPRYLIRTDGSRPAQQLTWNRPVFSYLNDDHIITEDSMASSTNPVADNVHQESKTMRSMESPMILEPVPISQPKSSWADWMSGFFLNDDQVTEGPGPLIGPMNVPGVGHQVYIRQNEPIDDDIDRVVIHVVNRDPPAYSSISPQYPQRLHNQSPYDTNGPPVSSESTSNIASGKPTKSQDELERDEILSEIFNENPWKLQTHLLQDKEATDKKSQHVNSNGREGIHNGESQSKFTVMLLKQAGSEPPTMLWSQHLDRANYGRSLKLTESNDPTLRSSISKSSLPSNNSVTKEQSQVSSKDVPYKIRFMKNVEQFKSLNNDVHYSTVPRYIHQNNTRVRSESTRANVPSVRRNHMRNDILHFKPTTNYLDEIALVSNMDLNRRQVNRADTASRISLNGHYNNFPDGSPRTPRNRYSGIRHFDKTNDIKKYYRTTPQPAVEISEVKSALHVVPAPNLENDTAETLTSRSKTEKEDVLQNIMTMTASQTWKNVTTRSLKVNQTKKAVEDDTKKLKPDKPVDSERRMDTEFDENIQTKEMSEKTKKARAMKEAVQKMMSTFTQWRHKVVSTAFVKELDDKKNEIKTDR